MPYIIRHIRIRYIIVFYFFLFYLFSNSFAQESSPLSPEQISDIRHYFRTSYVSISDFDDNDLLKNYKTRSVFILNYLQTLLRKVLDSNKDLLSQFGIKAEDIKITFRISDSSNITTRYNEICVYISRYDLLHSLTFATDVDFVAIYSHEIAHILLRHRKQSDDLKKQLMKEFIHLHENDADVDINITSEDIDTKTLEELYEQMSPVYLKKFIQYSQSNQDYLNLRRQGEIEADNLGFQIYLNTEFNIKSYGDSMLYKGLDQDRFIFLGDPLWLRIYMLKDYLIRMFEGSPYPTSDIEKIRSVFTRYAGGVDKRIEKHQYIYNSPFVYNLLNWLDPDSKPFLDHPTTIWRLWMIFQKEKNLSQDLINSKRTITTEYIRIDLSRFERLDDIRPFLNKKYSINDNLNLKNKKDPRFLIINALLDDNANVSYTLFSSAVPIESLGVIQSDNTVILKANDVFRVASLSLTTEISTLGGNSCTELFLNILDIKRQLLKKASNHMVEISTFIILLEFWLLSAKN